MASTHSFFIRSFFTVIRHSCEDDEVYDINNKLEEEYPVGVSVPFVFQQFIKWLSLEHLETILKQETKALPTLFRIPGCLYRMLLSLIVIGLNIKTALFTKQLSAECIKNEYVQ